MPLIQSSVSIPASSVIDNVIAGSQFEFLPYNAAREFDKPARQQYARDRKYAQGVADPSWHSDANIIGTFSSCSSRLG